MTKTYININGDVRDKTTLTVPQDRAFRAAWAFSGDAVEVDMPAALEIQKDNLRHERKPMLEALDVEFMLALETGGDTAAVAAKKNALRAVTDDARLAAATTPDELKALALAPLLGE